MLPIPIIIVISAGSIVVTAITIESIYVSIRNAIRKYKKNKLSRKYQGEMTTPNPIIELWFKPIMPELDSNSSYIFHQWNIIIL